MGDGFVGTGQVAFDAPDNARPYLHRVPPSMELFEPLLRALGVRDRFAPEDFVRTLATLKKQTTATAGSTEKSSKLDDAQLGLATSMCRLLLTNVDPAERDELLRRQAAYAPDGDCVMARARDLVYNDAPGLVSAVKLPHTRFVHPAIDNEAAAAIGVQSCLNRYLSSQADQEPVPCPAAGNLRGLTGAPCPGTASGGSRRCGGAATRSSGRRGGRGGGALRGRPAGARGRQAPRRALRARRAPPRRRVADQPRAGRTQGPALVCVLDGVALDKAALVQLSMPSSYDRVYGAHVLTSGSTSMGGGMGAMGGGMGGMGGGMGSPRSPAWASCRYAQGFPCWERALLGVPRHGLPPGLLRQSAHIFDPCGQFLYTGTEQHQSSSAASGGRSSDGGSGGGSSAAMAKYKTQRRSEPLGRRYALESKKGSKDIFSRFPDQFAPF